MKIILPLSVTLPRKTKADKVFILNLNTYRNTHYMTLNQAKVAWSDIVLHAHFEGEDVSAPYRFTYTIFPASNRKIDTSNVCSIIDKFTCDALIEFGIIPDDCHKVIPVIVYQFGEVDKARPRVELLIESLRNESLDPLTKVCEIAREVGL